MATTAGPRTEAAPKGAPAAARASAWGRAVKAAGGWSPRKGPAGRALAAADAALGWVPITPTGGLAALGLVATVRGYSGAQADLILVTVGVGGLTVLALNAASVVAVALWLQTRRARGTPEPAEALVIDAGRSTRTGFRFRALAWYPLVLFQERWERPAGVDARFEPEGPDWVEHARPTQRGWSDELVRRVTVRDWLGLSRVRFRAATARSVRALPWPGKAAELELVEQYRPGDVMGHPEGQPQGDFVEMRRYVAGDPLKLVLWKAYARSGKLLVRTAEKAVTPTDRMLAYLVAGEGDEPSSGIARAALEAGRLGAEVIFMADGAVNPAASPAEMIEQIVRSVDHRGGGGAGLDRFLVRGEKIGTGSAFLFVPNRPGAWLGRVCETIAAHRGPFRVVIGIDGLEPGTNGHDAGPGRWRRWLFRPNPEGPARLEDVRRARDRLTRAGAQVIVLDRSTGSPVAVPGMRASHSTLPLAKGESEGVSFPAVLAGSCPPSVPPW